MHRGQAETESLMAFTLGWIPHSTYNRTRTLTAYGRRQQGVRRHAWLVLTAAKRAHGMRHPQIPTLIKEPKLMADTANGERTRDDPLRRHTELAFTGPPG